MTPSQREVRSLTPAEGHEGEKTRKLGRERQQRHDAARQQRHFMFKHLKNAQLILYPDAGHGALFQYPERFVSHAALFLAE